MWIGTFDNRMGQSGAPDLRQQTHMGVAYIALTLLLVLFAWFASGEKGKRKVGIGGRSHKLRLPPGPRSWPVVGAVPYVSEPVHESLQELSRQYGPVMYMHLGSVPTLVVSTAAMAKEVFKTNDRVTASRPGFKAEQRLFYDAKDLIWAPYGSHWRKGRRICALKLFTATRINQLRGRRQEEIESWVGNVLKKSENGNLVELEDALEAMTMNVTTRMLWNKSHRGSMESGEFGDISRGSNDVLGKNIGDFIPSVNWLSFHVSGLARRIDALRKRWDDFCELIVQERRQQRLAADGGKAFMADDEADFLDVLLDLAMLPEDDPDHLTHFSVKALLADMIVAGTDTISITIHWALSFLLKHPHVMKRAQDEITAKVGTERMAAEEDVLSLPYLDAVLRETLRLHPPFPLGLPHFSITAFEMGGFHVPSDTLIFANIWAIQRDPATWDRPNEFEPDRFLSRGVDDWKGQSFEMIPFGSGRRICPGAPVAYNVLHLALAQMLHAIQWTLPGDQGPEDLDMAQKPGVQSRRAVPLRLLASPRLSNDVICSQ